MVGPSYLKSLQFLNHFSVKALPYPYPNSMKIKTLVHTHILRHFCRLIYALTKAKSKLIELLKQNSHDYYIESINKSIKNKKMRKKLFGSIGARYCWCSSHVRPMPMPIPMPEPSMDGLSNSHAYYDSTWNSVFPADDCEEGMESQLSGYLHWLEEKVPESSAVDVEVDEIDRLAAKFIATCHEKFRLEKQESYRRYQEMMARSI
ncbi:uncharacterized protein LOC122088817 [Macadamia integrifolia]|uniref:uncharacterized protein LOC122088817 n=1 Tax=Macadamia integrifolia TaxID=60698 RepID=UPI001C501235|nr:uncharacterized protein LOC122088817 [Macadamia integrifolia]